MLELAQLLGFKAGITKTHIDNNKLIKHVEILLKGIRSESHKG